MVLFVPVLALVWWRWQRAKVDNAKRWPKTEATIQSGAIEIVGSYRFNTVRLPVFAFYYQVREEYYSGRFALMPYTVAYDESVIDRMIGRKFLVCYDATHRSGEANSSHSWFCNIPGYRSGNRCRLRALADFALASWSTAAGNGCLSGHRRVTDSRRSPGPLRFLCPLRTPRSRYTSPGLSHTTLGGQWLISPCAKSHVCRGGLADPWSRIVFRQWTRLEYCIAVWVGFYLFVLIYEEPTLRNAYGPAYEEFCSNVPRWIPRLRPWRPPEPGQ